MVLAVLAWGPAASGETVWLDFSGAAWPTFTGKVAGDFEDAVLAAVQSDYADYPYLSFTETDPGGTDYTQIEFAESAAAGVLGDAHLVDWDNKLQYQNNINYANNARGAALDVYVSGFIEYGWPFTDSFSRFTTAVGGTTSHELGHALGLRHFDTFGPSPVPGSPGPMANHHIMATGPTGLGLTDRTDYDRVFSEHSADKLAYLDPVNKATRKRTEMLFLPYAHDSMATAEDLTIGPADIVPQTGRMVMVKDAFIFGVGESDFYYFHANAGDRIYANIFSSRLTMEDGIRPGACIDSVLRLYDPTGAVVYFNDDTGYNPTDEGDPGIGDSIGAGGGLTKDESLLINGATCFSADGSAGDSPFTTYTTDSILLDSPSGDFFTLGVAGRWYIEVAAADESDIGNYELFVAMTPEPMTVSLMLAGGLGLLRRKRK